MQISKKWEFKIKKIFRKTYNNKYIRIFAINMEV